MRVLSYMINTLNNAIGKIEAKPLIEEAIDELHYEVNEIARGLVKNKTKTLKMNLVLLGSEIVLILHVSNQVL